MVWLQSDGALVFLQCETVLHASCCKPIFEDVGSGKLSVAEAGPVVRVLGQKLQAWATNPRDALTCEGRGMELVRESPLRLAVQARLGVIFQTMGKRWGGYTKGYSAGGTLNVQSSPHPHFLQATRATSVFEERYFGVLSDVLKLGGKKMAPWRAAATTLSRQNRAVEMPLQSDVPFIVRRAQAVEEVHGGSIASFRRIPGARKAADVQQKEAVAQHKATAKAARAQQSAAKRQKKNHADRDFFAKLGSRSFRYGRQTATPARLLD